MTNKFSRDTQRIDEEVLKLKQRIQGLSILDITQAASIRKINDMNTNNNLDGSANINPSEDKKPPSKNKSLIQEELSALKQEFISEFPPKEDNNFHAKRNSRSPAKAGIRSPSKQNISPSKNQDVIQAESELN